MSPVHVLATACLAFLAGPAGAGAPPAAPMRPAWESAHLFEQNRHWKIRITEPGACVAERALGERADIEFHEQHDRVTAALWVGRESLGRVGVIQADDATFEFEVENLGGGHVAFRPALDGRQLQKLRGAKALNVAIDGRELGRIEVSATNLPAALDDVHKCALGALGWWGQGGATRNR